jgi:hypothetical protein
MNKEQWLPGPWKIAEGADVPAAYIYSDDGYVVCRFWSKDTWGLVLYQHNKATANLVVTAPDLYAALEWAMQHGTFDVPNDDPMLARARSVLAEARGEKKRKEA